MSDQGLRVQLGEVIALIRCEHPVIRHWLRHHFYACGETVLPAGITYSITTHAGERVQLQRDGHLLYRGGSSTYLIERLMQDMTMSLAARCRQHLVFHAAALAREKCGLILCGQSGRGKSTLAAQLSAVGFDYLTDELVTISLDRGSMQGLRRSIVLKAGSAFPGDRYLTTPAQQDLARLSSGAVWLSPGALGSQWADRDISPQILIFPQYQPAGAFSVQALTAAEIVFQLMLCLINANNLPQQGFAAVTRLARHVAAYRLTYANFEAVRSWLEQREFGRFLSSSLPG